MMTPMSVTVLHMLEWPAAILAGYAAGKFARLRHMPLWLACAGVLAAGVLVHLVCDAVAVGPEHPWTGLLIWLTWSPFGIEQGWRGERRSSPLTTLNLSGKE